MQLILSSTSSARKQLLERLQIPFLTVAPEIDETPLPGEKATELVIRLAEQKAQIHAKQFPSSLIIGCDQVALINNKIVSKPETHENAVKQLLEASGKAIKFYTGICLFNTLTGNKQIAIEEFTVQYRELNLSMIENYLHKEKPYYCAGSIHVEKLGIILLKSVIGHDPTALIGLPLIKLTEMLSNEGIRII